VERACPPKSLPRAAVMAASLLLLCLGWAAPAAAQAAPSQTVRLTVRAGEGWTETGIVVAEGDRLIIQASRIAPERTEGPAAGQSAPPRDTARAANTAPQRNPEEERRRRLNLPDVSAAALFGRIGKKSFPIVGQHDSVATAPGRLQLRIRVALSIVGGRPRLDNSAAFNVVATRIPAVKTQPPDEEVDPIANKQEDISVKTDPDGTGQGNEAEKAGGGNEAAPIPPTENEQAAQPEGTSPEGEEIRNEGAAAGAEPTDTGQPPPDDGSAGWALTAGLGVLLALIVAALAAGFAVHQARIAKTRGLLSLSPSIDFGQGGLAIGPITPDGPETRLRARLEMGRTIRTGPAGNANQGVDDG
jgi:hypothetical protein